ncbi:MAG: Lumazine-binding domain protein [Bacteroidetes bacterium]|jgi:hypothetical protein|nr:Lumazine-binding domain protein [Bacteroidota bacterium]
MKRLCGFVTIFVLVTLVVACGGMTPTSVAEDMAKCIQSGDYNKLAENLASDSDADTIQIVRDKQQFVAFLKEKVEKQFAKNGGIVNYRVIGEAVTPDESKAYVRISYWFKNGTSIDEIVPLVKSDGRWKYILQ